MNKTIISLALGTFVLTAGLAHAEPNVLIIIADDCTYNDLPLHGGQNAHTPHIDKLAQQGLTFNRAYLSAAMCQPSRSELYTGMYPMRNGCAWNHSSSRPHITSMPHHLRKLGYRVGLAGKVHVEPADVYPFDKVDGFDPNCVAHPTRPHELEMAENYMNEGDGPFCLVIALTEPHVPWVMGDASRYPPNKITLPANLVDTPQTREDFSRYLAEITYMDSQVGDILAALDGTGKADDTLVLFSSEQGSQFPGCKWTNYDTGLHTALVARWPGNTPAGKRTDALVQYADILPTLIELGGGDPAGKGCDGTSFLSTLHGKSETHRAFAYGVHNNVPEGPPYPIRTVTDGTHRYIRNLLPDELYIEKHLMGRRTDGHLGNPYWPTWVRETWVDPHAYSMVKRYMSRPAEELFHTAEDPYELTNLAGNPDFAQIKAGLSVELDRWLKTQGDPGADQDTTRALESARQGNHLFVPDGKTTAEKPNFVIIFVDDMGYADIGPFGQKVIKTPSLDRMASEGMKFTSFYASFPLCSPSRVSLLNGCYPTRASIPRVFFPDDIYGLNPKEITIADVLKGQGYATMCIGKWHVGHKAEFLPTRQGFDHFVGLSHSNNNSLDPTAPIAEDANLHGWTRERIKTEKLKDNVVPLYRDEEVVEYPFDQDFMTSLYNDEALKFMETNKERPFFLYLAHSMVHGPLAASPAFRGKSAGGLYGDAVEEIDWGVGQILDFLRENGLAENTYVVFTSDNGPWLTPELTQGDPGPLRGGKGETYEGGVRVPTVMWWPETIPAGTVCDEVAGIIDMMPTLARLAGTSEPKDRVIDGHDIRPLFEGVEGAPSEKDKIGYYYYGHGSRLEAVRLGKWKLRHAGQDVELYDLEADIGEQHNLAGNEPEMVERLLAMMKNFDAELKANPRPAGAEGGRDVFDMPRMQPLGTGSQWWEGLGLVDAEVGGVVADFGTALLNGKFALGIGSPDTTLTTTQAINDGEWHHVAASWDAGTGAVTLYLDGLPDRTGTSPTGPRTDSTILQAGKIHAGGAHFTGLLDEVRLYDSVLPASAVAALASGAGRSSSEVSATPAETPTAHYPFEGDVLDVSGNGNHGKNFGVTFAADSAEGAFAGNFDGNDRFEIPACIGQRSFTIALWVKTTTTKK